MDKVQLAITYAKRMLVDSIWKSAGIEGLHVTFPETFDILNNIPVNMKPNDVMFILNMRDAWEFVIDTIGCDVDVAYIRQLNKICGEKLIYDSGVLRTSHVGITGSWYKPAIPQLPDVEESLAKINTIQDQEIRATSLFLYLARSQLFIDGNKRVAQLVMNKVLIEAGIGILNITEDMLNEFFELLIEYYETNEPLRVMNFMLSKCIFRI